MPCCCAVNCHNRAIDGYKLYNIPNGIKDQERRKEWLTKINRKDFIPTKRTVLCEVHFDEKQFEKNIAKNMKPNAVPSIFSHRKPVKIRSSPNKRGRDNNTGTHTSPRKRILFEHGYCSENTCNNAQLVEPNSGVDNQVELPVAVASLMKLPFCSAPQPVSEFVAGVQDVPQPDPRLPPTLETVESLQRAIHTLTDKVSSLKGKIRTMETNFKRVFNDDQLLAMQHKKGVVTWSDETVKKALQLRFSCGYSGYQMLLEQGIPLPADRTLRQKLENIPFHSGIGTDVFKMLESKVRSMRDEETKVSLTLDEMAIQPSLDFDNRSGTILGFPTVPNAKNDTLSERNLATHALVFMLRGLSTPWKQAVAYEYTENSVSASSVKSSIISVIKKAHDIGLEVVNVTMDMGGGNQAVFKEFGLQCKRNGIISNSIPHPVVRERCLYFFSDFPHLLKSLRNHLTRGQVLFLPDLTVRKFNLTTNTVSITYIENLIKIDEKHNLKLAPFLKESHLKLGHFEKMKVAPAQILLSRQTAAALRILVERNLLIQDALTTAWFLEQTAMWYDLVTSRSIVTALSHFSEEKLDGAISHLTDYINLIKNIHIGSQVAPWKPVQRGIVLSTTSMLEVKDAMLNDNNFKFLLTSRFTQDCLENLFSTIRFRNPVPTALEFKNSLRIICMSHLLKSKERGSYNIDPCVDLPVTESTTAKKQHSDDAYANLPAISTNQYSVFELSEVEELSLYNLSGFCVAKFIKLSKNCQNCVTFLTTEDRPSVSDLTAERCYKVDALTFSSLPVFELVKIGEQVIHDLGTDIFKSPSVILRLVKETLTRSEHLNFPNCHNVKKNILTRFFKTRVFSYLKEQKVVLKKTQKDKIKFQARGSRSMAMRENIKNIKDNP